MPEPSTTKCLICSPSWIGDVIMSLPAIAAYREQYAISRLGILSKPQTAALWNMVPFADRVHTVPPAFGDMIKVSRALRMERYDKAWVLPNSWRSALTPWLAGIPDRIGYPGHGRAWLLSRTLSRPADRKLHQVLEVGALFGLPADESVYQRAEIPVTADDQAAAKDKFGLQDTPYVGLIPGAARGPAKQWPEHRYRELALHTHSRLGCRLCLFGTTGEYALCERIAAGIPNAVNMAGRTTLAEWAALLKQCLLIICNDSGGMHLAGAVGTPTVAVFGMTNPGQTAPWKANVRILQKSAFQQRDIKRSCREAEQSLNAISVEEVLSAAQAAIYERNGGSSDDQT